MKKLNNQETDPVVKGLQKLLSALTFKERSEQQWQVLENNLFAQLDEIESKSHPVKRWRYSFGFPFQFGRGAVVATSITLCVVLLSTLFFGILPHTTAPLVESRILGVRGQVVVTDENASEVGFQQVTVAQHNLDTFDKGAILKANQIIEASEQAKLVVQIDNQSHFILSENSKLTVRKANSREIELYLHRGEFFCSLKKRDKSQTFTVLTPNTISRIIGTIFTIRTHANDNDKRITNLSVFKGKVKISNYEEYLGHDFISSGQSIQVSTKERGDVFSLDKDQMPIRSLSLLKLLSNSNNATDSMGMLDIRSEPLGAEVYIHGEPVGKTPLLTKYRKGAYEITVKREGFNPWSSIVSLAEGKIAFVEPHLSKDSSKIDMMPPFVSAKKRRAPLRSSQYKSSLPSADMHDFSLNPAFIEALIQMTIGEYQKALVVLDSLKVIPGISLTNKVEIINKIAECYRGMGNFHKTLGILDMKYRGESNPVRKSNLLWEMIILKANCLGDFNGAKANLQTYIHTYPQGSWIETAYAKLGEVYVLLENYAKAVSTYKAHIQRFGSGKNVENSLYTLANINRSKLDNCKEALHWYSKLIKTYPHTSFMGSALFERAECYRAYGMPRKAKKDYEQYLSLFPTGHLYGKCRAHLALLP